MRFYFFILITTVFLISCRSHRDHSYVGIPQDSIIERQMMISMLADVHVIESAIQQDRNRGLSDPKRSVVYYQELFSKYRVSERRFKESLNYYKQDQADFIKMYDEIIDTLRKKAEKAGVAIPAKQ